jgi:catechol 2,3-dioxygenase-like lactoylglutathione lyase family enzyme
MPLPVTFDHCVVHVSDWERSNAFYRDVLGAELVRRPQGWAYRFGAAQ